MTEMSPLIRAQIILVRPRGARILHGMWQRPPVLRHSQRIASIEPVLAERTPRKIIGVEGSVLGGAGSAIRHIRLQSLRRRCAGAPGHESSHVGEAFAPPATLLSLPNP